MNQADIFNDLPTRSNQAAKRKSIAEADILANPKLFAEKVYEVAELFKSVQASFD